MTVGEVIARLSSLPSGMPVYVRNDSVPLPISDAKWELVDVGTKGGTAWNVVEGDPDWRRDTFDTVQLALVIDIGGLE